MSDRSELATRAELARRARSVARCASAAGEGAWSGSGGGGGAAAERSVRGKTGVCCQACCGGSEGRKGAEWVRATCLRVRRWGFLGAPGRSVDGSGSESGSESRWGWGGEGGGWS